MRKNLLLMYFLSGAIFAQDSVKDLLKQAEKHFDRKDYQSAHSLYSNVFSSASNPDHRAHALYMMAMCSYGDGRYDRAEREFSEFTNTYPDHPLVAQASLYLAHIYYLMKDYFNSALNFSRAMRSRNPSERKQARDELENLLSGHVALDDFPVLIQMADPWSESLIAYYWLKRLESKGEYARALMVGRKLLQQILGTPDEKYKINQLLEKIERQLKEQMVILAVVPQSGEFADFGKDVLRGIQLAFSQTTRNEKIELVTVDSGSDVLSAARAVKQFLEEKTPLCIIGPVTSDEAVVVGTVASSYNIPLITPTASRNGIAELSPYIFQLVASSAKASKHLALFVADSFDTFSVLAPDDPVGHACADAFIDGVREKNKQVMSVVFYRENTMDFTEVITRLKEPFLKLLDRVSVRADSTDTVFYDCNVLRGCVMRDRAKWLVSTQVIFIPANSTELENIVPQIPFMYLNARIAGANGWVAKEIVRKKSLMNILTGAFFIPDDFHIEKSINEWSEFAVAYSKKYKSEPTRLSALGYDAGRIVLHGIENGAVTQELMKDYLSRVKNYYGAGGPVSFDENGANKVSVILKIEDFQLRRVW